MTNKNNSYLKENLFIDSYLKLITKMNYLVECQSKRIIIKDIYKENSNWINAMKNYLNNDTNSAQELKSFYNEMLNDMGSVLDNTIAMGINIFSKLTFERPVVDEVRLYINFAVLHEIRDVLEKFNLDGIYIWLSIYQQDKYEVVVEIEDVKKIVNSLKLIAPYFEEFDLFAKFDNKGNKDPFAIDIEKVYENFYLIPVLTNSIDNNCSLTVTKL